MRVGLLTDLQSVNSCYRGLPVFELQRRGHVVCMGSHRGGGIEVSRLRACDVVHVYRYHEAEMRRIAEQLAAAGVAVVWDNDDDLTSGPRGVHTSVAKGSLRSQQAHADMIRMLRLAHAVTTPSAELADQYRKWGAECVEVIENYLPADYAPQPRAAHAGVTVGWTAGWEHRYDLEQLGLRSTLRELLDADPALRVCSIGLDLRLGHDRYRHILLVQYGALASHVAEFDVGIAPIADIPFNRARSNVKVKEYAAAGVPWRASPIGPYAALGERQGGRLVPDEGWRNALEQLVRDARARRKLASRGRKWAASQTVARNVECWEHTFRGAIERARKRP